MTQDGEQYGMVTKMLGNSQCHVFCLDGTTRLCIIRKNLPVSTKVRIFKTRNLGIDWTTRLGIKSQRQNGKMRFTRILQ